MSAYKKLNRQDVYVTDYVSRKQWQVTTPSFPSYGIKVYRGVSGSIQEREYLSDTFNGYSQNLIYESVKHLYYTGSLGDGTFTGSRDLSLQTTLTQSGSRVLQGEVAVMSIPRSVYGMYIEPGSILLESLETSSLYLEEEYVADGYIGYSGSLMLTDNKRGCLIASESGEIVGDIIYNQGQVIITRPDEAGYFGLYSVNRLSWKSNYPVYTYSFHCKIKDSEFNSSFNPTCQTGSYGDLSENGLNVDFKPYITTLGLYNEANQLVAVAKTSRPIPKAGNVDMTFIVKLDI